MKGSTIVCAAVAIALLVCSGQALAEIDPDTILGIWLLDEGQGDTAKDDSGNGYDGTLENSPEWVGGQFGNALLFDGASTYVNCGNPAAFNTDLFSVSFWCNIPATQGWNHMISRGQHVASGDPGSVNWGVMMYSAQETILYETFNDTGWVGITAATTTNEWHHVVATYDGATMQLYHDGALAASGSNGILLDETRWFLIGARADAGAAGGFFNGSLDEVGYFNAVLSIEDIETIMNNGLSILVGGTTEAEDPVPAHGETDVPRDGTLGWTPGMYAQTHDVYLGTSLDDVAAATTSDPRGVLLAQGLPDTSIDHGRLEFDQTYYWRVDEVNGAPDYSVYKGDVWTFTTEPFAYPIQGVTATSNTTSEAGQGPDRLVDGSGLNTNDQHSTRTGDMWAGTPNPDGPSYVQFEFDGLYKLHEMLVWNYNFEFEMFLGFGVKEVTVAYSTDGTNWTVLGDEVELGQGPGLATYDSPTVIPLGGAAARYVRLTVNSAWSASPTQYGLSEVRFTYIAAYPREPHPADGTTGVSPDATLSWRSGRGAGQHEIYFGTDVAGLDLVDTTAQSLYSPDLDLGTTYYWQIVEVNEAETVPSWTGNVWSFTTQEHVVIDSFESYVDDETAGDVIWEIWIDGLVAFGGDAANGGSQVGHDTSPFAEQTIVHGGRQSMPLYFDNASASEISEVDRTLSPAQDWTVNGIQTLSLWFYGVQGNTGRLYAKINNGSRITYDGPATDIGTPGWQKWNIALADAGGNLSNVTSLSIGVEGAGSGLVYIDDIQLSATVATPRTSDISIAISTQANWWSQAAADREMEEIVDKAQAPVVVFNAGDQDGLAQWVSDHTNNGVANLLILCGQLPDTIYEPGNTQADDSLVEQFLDAGNTVINTGDWIFYVVNGGGTNGAAGLQTIMDIPGVTVAGGDDTPVTVTAEGQEFTPSLQDFATDRPFHLDTLEGDWSTELVLAQTADGLLADPAIVKNSVTGGRIGIFYQASGEDDLPRGEVISEWINNWYLDAASGN